MKNNSKRKKKIISGILAIALVITMIPATTVLTEAASTDKAIMLGVDGIDMVKNGDVENSDKIIMGEYNGIPVPWVKLNNSGLMFSQYVLDLTSFAPYEGVGTTTSYYSETADNLLYAKIQSLYNTELGFTPGEKEIIKATTLTKDSIHTDAMELANQYLFPLSKQEAEDMVMGNEALGYYVEFLDGRGGDTYAWSLRSSQTHYIVYYAAYNKIVATQDNLDDPAGVRPAFNLDMNSVLFTSAAVDGKPSYSGVEGATLEENPNKTVTEWKMTLLDSDRTFGIFAGSMDKRTVSLDYTGAITGPNEYISILIVDEANNITHYSKVEKVSTGANGTISFTIPDSFKEGEKIYLKVFNEQDNGNNKTDYASEMVEVLIVTPPAIHTISATAGPNGTITPAGDTDVSGGGSQIYNFTANPGYEIDTITVDGKLVAKADSYTFTKVSGNHSIHVKFTETSPTSENKYKIIKGDNQEIIEGSDDDIVVVAEGDLSNFRNLYINGALLNTSKYSSESGSVMITIDGDYIKTLSVGTHLITMEYVDGEAETNLQVIAAPINAPDTGDDSNIMMFMLFAFASVIVVGYIFYKKKAI